MFIFDHTAYWHAYIANLRIFVIFYNVSNKIRPCYESMNGTNNTSSRKNVYLYQRN
jgi:hypothetical protein